MIGKCLSRLAVLGCILASAPRAYSGGVVGNGGDAIVCGSAAPRLLDYFEAEQAGATIDMGGGALNLRQKVQLAISRIAPFDQALAADLTAFGANFVEQLSFEDEVPPIDDSGLVDVPAGCSLQQLAAQFDPRFNGDIVYVVDTQVWNALSVDDQAGLVLHELLFHYARLLGAKDSTGIRKFNGVVSSTAFATYTTEQYAALVAETELDKLRSVFGFRDQVVASPLKIGQDFYWLANDTNSSSFYGTCSIAKLEHGQSVPTYVYPQTAGCKSSRNLSNAVLFAEGEYLYFVERWSDWPSVDSGVAVSRLNVETLESEIVFRINEPHKVIMSEILKSGDDYFFRLWDDNTRITDLVKVNSQQPSVITILQANLRFMYGKLALSDEFLLAQDGTRILRVVRDGSTPAIEIVSDPMLLHYAVYDGQLYCSFNNAHPSDLRGGVKVKSVSGGAFTPVSLGHRYFSFLDIVEDDLVWVSRLSSWEPVLNVYKLDGSATYSRTTLKSNANGCGTSGTGSRIFADEDSYYWSAGWGRHGYECGGYIIKFQK